MRPARPDGRPTLLTAEEEAYVHLSEGLRTGRYAPQTRLIPDEIAALLGMSRMPVREAFRRLASEGLLSIRPNRGAIVSGLTMREMEEAFEMRAALEGLAARLATPLMTQAHADQLSHLADRMIASATGSVDDWIAEHWAFHEYVAGVSDRPRLLRTIAGLHSQIEPYLRVWHRGSAPTARQDVEHRALIRVLVQGDPASSDAAVRSHILETVPIVLRFMAETGHAALSASVTDACR